MRAVRFHSSRGFFTCFKLSTLSYFRFNSFHFRRINKYYSQNIFRSNYRQYISNYIIYRFVEAHWRNTCSFRPRYTHVIHLLKQKDHRSRHLQMLIPLHIDRWRRSHRYTNEFLNNFIFNEMETVNTPLCNYRTTKTCFVFVQRFFFISRVDWMSQRPKA